MRKVVLIICMLSGSVTMSAQIQTNAGVQYLQCMQKDVSTDFYDLSNTYFLADSLTSFNVAKGEGLVNWKRYRMSPRQAFNLNGYWPVRMQMLDFPDAAYDNDPNLRISIEFISEKAARIRMLTTPIVPKDNGADDPMFDEAFKARYYSNALGEKAKMPSWSSTDNGKSILYNTKNGSIEIQRYPFRIVLRDAKGKILTQTRHIIDNDSTQVKLLPFSFIKRGSDNSRSVNRDLRPTVCTNPYLFTSPIVAMASSCTPRLLSPPTSELRTSVPSGSLWLTNR